MRKVSKLVAVLAALAMVMAAFMAPAFAKNGKGKGQGKGKKATVVSYDEATRTLVLTNKKGGEHTFTVAEDARLTKVVPCDEEDDSTDDSTEDSTEDSTDDSTDDSVEGSSVEEDSTEDSTDDSTEDSTEDDDAVKTCGNMAATTADLVAGYRVLNYKAKDGVVSKLKVKVPHQDDSEEGESVDPGDGTEGDGSVDDGAEEGDDVVEDGSDDAVEGEGN